MVYILYRTLYKGQLSFTTVFEKDSGLSVIYVLCLGYSTHLTEKAMGVVWGAKYRAVKGIVQRKLRWVEIGIKR